MAHHKDLTGTDLHEPKGVATASSGQVYVANGSGSGAWTDRPSVGYALTRAIADVSTPGDVYVSVPFAGTIAFITGVLEAGTTVADSLVTFKINGVSVDTSTLTVTSGSAAGAQFNSTPTGHNAVVAGDVIKITTDGGSTSTAPFIVTVLIHVD
jgi:hypothetical protein